MCPFVVQQMITGAFTDRAFLDVGAFKQGRDMKTALEDDRA